MASSPMLTRITFRAPTPLLAREGLVCWVDADHGAVALRGIELRRTWDGRHVISFAPTRVIDGRPSSSARPVSDAARRALEAEIFAAAARQGLLQ